MDGTDLQLLTPWHHQAIVTTNLLLQAISLVSAHPKQLNSTVAQRHGDLFQLRVRHRDVAPERDIQHGVLLPCIQPATVIIVANLAWVVAVPWQVRNRRADRVYGNMGHGTVSAILLMISGSSSWKEVKRIHCALRTLTSASSAIFIGRSQLARKVLISDNLTDERPGTYCSNDLQLSSAGHRSKAHQ